MHTYFWPPGVSSPIQDKCPCNAVTHLNVHTFLHKCINLFIFYCFIICMCCVEGWRQQYMRPLEGHKQDKNTSSLIHIYPQFGVLF